MLRPLFENRGRPRPGARRIRHGARKWRRLGLVKRLDLRSPLLFAIAIALLPGCRHLPEAPQELDELCGYLFQHANDEPEDLTIEAGAINLDAWLDINIDATAEGYSVNTLSDDAVNALDDGDRSLDGVKGAAVGYTSENDLETLMSTLVSASPADMYPDEYLSFQRTWNGDPDCFAAGDCDSLEAESFSTLSLPAGIQADVDSMVQYRWVDTEDFGRIAVQRTWMHVPPTLNVTWLTVDQQYYVWMFIPNNDAGGSRSIQATWMVASFLGTAPPEDFVLNTVVSSMQGNSTGLDDWIASH